MKIIKNPYIIRHLSKHLKKKEKKDCFLQYKVYF